MSFEGNNAFKIDDWPKEENELESKNKKTLIEFLDDENMFKNERLKDLIMEEKGEDLRAFYEELLEQELSPEQLKSELRKHLIKSGYNSSLLEDIEPSDLVKKVIEDNLLLKEHLIDKNNFENDHPRITEAIPLAKNLLKEFDQEEVKEKIFMHLLDKVEDIKVKTEKETDPYYKKLKEAYNFTNELAGEISDIKKSADSGLIREKLNQAKDILDSISEMDGKTAARIKNKIQSQIDYLEK